MTIEMHTTSPEMLPTNSVRPGLRGRLLAALLVFVTLIALAATIGGWAGITLLFVVAGVTVSTWLGLYTIAGIGG